MNTKQIAVKSLKFAVGFCVTGAVSSAIRNNADSANYLQKGQAVVGAAVIGMIAAERTEAWIDAKIEQIAAKKS